MQFWPSDNKQLQRVIIFLLFMFLATLFLVAIIFVKFKDLVQTPSCTTNSSFQVKTSTLTCPQRVDASGWILKNNQIRIFPRCLTVMNSKFGSRFNFDWHFSNQKITSSILGTLEDQDTFFTLSIEDKDKLEQIFPILSNDPFPNRSVDLGLTYQKTNFENDDLLVSLNTVSPFCPSESAQDENNIMNTAPFFNLELSLTNKTSIRQSKKIIISFTNAIEIKNKDTFKVIYLNDESGRGGTRALAISQNQTGLDLFINGKYGGIEWQVEIEPNSSVSTEMIYAGFFDGIILTDSSQTQVRKLKFFYTQWFDNVDQVIEFAFDNQEKFEAKRSQFEKGIQARSLSPQIKWLLAQSFHSYLGNSWLVYDEKDENHYEYYLWEGEFKFLNTLDVAHDYGVLEGLYFPWVLKLELQSWQKNVKEDELGLVIPHDLGSRFNLRGSSAYGIDGSETSGMPVEENSNFILLAHWYWKRTGDDQFVKELSPLLKDLIRSLIKRDSNNNGIADELVRMTTYDNDGNSALKEAPDSSYLGVKQLAAYVSAKEIFKSLDDKEFQQEIDKQSELITHALKQAYSSYGFIPLSLDPTFKEKNLFDGKEVYGIEEQGFAFITGLFYPTLTDLDSDFINELSPLLASSYSTAYEKSLVKDQTGKNIGLQLAENQALALGWLSHSAMADFIASKLFNQEYESTKFYFPLLYDNPFSFADGQYFKAPLYPPQTMLRFYPRGVTLFAYLLDQSWEKNH